MRNLILATALIASVPAHAQAVGTSTTDAAADATNNVSVVAVAGPQGNSEIDYSGHTWTTPTVLGSNFAGANPCLVGTGGGVAGGPLGLSLSIGKSDKECSRRSDAAAWHALGLSGVAIARMCEDEENADAFWSSTGFVCPGADPERYQYSDGTPGRVAIVANNFPVSERVGTEQ